MFPIVGQVLFLIPSAVFCLLATYNFLVYRKVTPIEKPNALNPESVSVYVPVFNDNQVLSSLPYLAALDYPSFNVKILDDSTDQELNRSIDKFVTDHKAFSVIRRDNRFGFKGGAIQNALKDEKSVFICILDCDFRPSENFLSLIVRAMEANKADVIQGYPRQMRGSESALGTYCRASSAGSILCLAGREKLHLAPIMYGSCFLMKTTTAKKVGFKGQSITEDINFSIRAYSTVDFRVAVCPEILADGGCPVTVKDFMTQQLRWCEGTIRDVFCVNFRAIFKIKSARKKFDLLMNGLHFSSGFFLLWAFIALLFRSIDPIIGLFITIYTSLGFAYPLMLGASLEKFSVGAKIKTLIFGFFLVYVMCPLTTYGFLKGLSSKNGSFKVTHKS